MSYNSSSKVSDIITALQGITGINQQASLNSALVSKGLTVGANDSVASMINTLSNAPFKRWASGSGTSGGTSINVTGLIFKPNYILLEYNTSTNTRRSFHYKDTQFATIDNYAFSTSGSFNGTAWVIGTNGFTATTDITTQVYTWIAFE